MTTSLSLPAVEFVQGRDRRLYALAIDAKLLPFIATVSRIQRDEEAQVAGYQRPESNRHVRAIRDYIESDDPMIPNALVIAFDSRVTFRSLDLDGGGDAEVIGARHGVLTIPLDRERPVGFIVDGQQRSAAVRDALVPRFPMPVTAFITDSQDEQRTQFILVNSTKPLPVGLINELLPSTVGRLPVRLERRRAPAMLLEQLNLDERSPLFQMIRTVTWPRGVIKDTSVLKLLESSIENGALYGFRDPRTGAVESEPALEVLGNFWKAVRLVFPEAIHGEISTRRSRLIHGAGVVALGNLMDTIVETGGRPTIETFEAALRDIAPACAWTSGEWVFSENDRRPWNAVQNTSKDIDLLSGHLRDALLGPSRT